MTTEKQEKFLLQRRMFQRFWPYAGGFCLALLLGLSLWLWMRSPLLVNPNLVVERIGNRTLETCSVQAMAVMLPVTMIALLIVTLAFILLSFSALGNERRLLEIIDASAQQGDDLASPAEDEG